MRAWRKAALIAAPIVAVLSISAHATLDAMASPTSTAPVPAQTPAPIAAVPAIAAFASPAEGTTGTVELPPVPVAAPIALAAADRSIVAAQPFSMALTSRVDRSRALECLTAAIYYEAASESDDGQRGVAQVVLNRVRHPTFPATVCGVVYQGSERTSGCQFSYACDGSMARIPSRAGWARAAMNAAAALAGYVHAPVGLATHYHTYAVTPSWNRTLVMTDAIGAHFFHRWKGWWGTAAAFRQGYRGGEPFPGPHARPVNPAKSMVALATIPALPARATPPAQVQPVYAASGAPIDATRALPEDSQILDRWKDSGKPINQDGN